MLVADLMSSRVLPSILKAEGTLTSASAKKCGDALGAIMADVINATRQQRASSRSVRNGSFSSPCPVGRLAFRRVMNALIAEGLIDHRKGHRVKEGPFGTERDVPSLFQATPALLELADGHELLRAKQTSSDFTHGKRDLSDGAQVVVARKKIEKDQAGQRPPPQDLDWDPSDPLACKIAARMERMNAFLLEPGRVEGLSFGGLRRIFSNANLPGFQWQWGGRLNTLPGWDAYESWKGGAQTRRQIIELEGEPVMEADISAAFLTILYGLLGEPFDNHRPPYDIGDGISTERAKAWCTIALGSFKLSAGGRPFSRVKKAFIERHPILQSLETCGLTNADLQYHESEIILSAVEVMRDSHGVAALPVHDCIVVPRSMADVGRQVLEQAFYDHLQDVVGCPHPFLPLVTLK
ncbi:hypothetical protein [Croceicoccus ponticola]|nr:hypothetical protein [Croceicoccus ponticola]